MDCVIISDSLKKWRLEERSAIWLQIPIQSSRYIEVAAQEGFVFHNAEADQCLLKLWLKDGQDMTPRFATHQLGVCGKTVCFQLFTSLFWKEKSSSVVIQLSLLSSGCVNFKSDPNSFIMWPCASFASE